MKLFQSVILTDIGFLFHAFSTFSLSLSHSEYAINDKEVVLATLKLKQLLGDRVMVLTDLVEESHVHLLDGKSQSSKCCYGNLTR